jgi:hypothetical protein
VRDKAIGERTGDRPAPPILCLRRGRSDERGSLARSRARRRTERASRAAGRALHAAGRASRGRARSMRPPKRAREVRRRPPPATGARRTGADGPRSGRECVATAVRASDLLARERLASRLVDDVTEQASLHRLPVRERAELVAVGREKSRSWPLLGSIEPVLVDEEAALVGDDPVCGRDLGRKAPTNPAPGSDRAARGSDRAARGSDRSA